MIDEGPLEFGAPPPTDELADAEENEDGDPSNAIPFPRMRPSSALRKSWAEAVARRNDRDGKRLQMLSPLDVVPSLMARRAMPCMAWPADWPDLADRCKTYPGQCVSITGPIGGGKTSFALQILIANMGQGHPGLWAALELSAEELDLRVVANQHGSHMHEVRELWSQDRIVHSLTAIDDMMHFVDQHHEPEMQFSILEDAIQLAWEVYRVPPVWVVDHLGELVAEERDDRAATRKWAHRFRMLAERTNSFGLLLNQVSKGNQANLTGKADYDTAAEALAVEMGSQAIASAVANAIALLVFKSDDTPVLDSHVLTSKARNTGKEGRTGFRFSKAGGRWKQLDYLPATPSQQRAAVESDKKDKHRTQPPRSPAEVRADLNSAAAGDAAAMQRSRIMQAVMCHGALGIADNDLRKVPGVGRGAAFRQALGQLTHAGSIERIAGNRWRAVTGIG